MRNLHREQGCHGDVSHTLLRLRIYQAWLGPAQLRKTGRHPRCQVTALYLICPQEPAGSAETDEKAAGGVLKSLPTVPPGVGKCSADSRQTEPGEGWVRRRASDSPSLQPQFGSPPEEDDEPGESYAPRFSQHTSGQR